MLNEIEVQSLPLDALVTLYQTVERDILWRRLDQWRLALTAKRSYGVSPAEFARMVGMSYDTTRERVAMAEFYAPVWDELKAELQQSETLYHKHLILAKRGLCDLPPMEGASKALVRLQDWAARGLSVEAAKVELDGAKDSIPIMVTEFECTRRDLLPRIRQIIDGLDDGDYVVSIRRKVG